MSELVKVYGSFEGKVEDTIGASRARLVQDCVERILKANKKLTVMYPANIGLQK